MKMKGWTTTWRDGQWRVAIVDDHGRAVQVALDDLVEIVLTTMTEEEIGEAAERRPAPSRLRRFLVVKGGHDGVGA